MDRDIDYTGRLPAGSMVSIITNFTRLDPILEKLSKETEIRISCEPVPGATHRFRALKTFRKILNKDILILNVEESLLFALCLLKYLFPWNRCLIVSVDLILRAPTNFRQRALCRLKGLILQKADYFLLYHKDVSGYAEYFGIRPRKCVYVPFKVNHLNRIQEILFEQTESADPTDGDYILAAGRSQRDLKTFVDAMAMTGLPGILLRQERSILAQNATLLEYGSLPSNLTEIVDRGTDRSFIHYMTQARVIVIPRYHRDINATGIATYLMAMALKKCVIISHGPGTTDLLLNNEAILVPPEDPVALSVAIKKAWDDPVYRCRIASNGQRYSFLLKDESRLMNDILKMSLHLYKNDRTPIG